LAKGQSLRQIAGEVGVPSSTLQDWQNADTAPKEAPAALAAFVATPEGVHWLKRMVIAAHFSITLRGAAGVRMLSRTRRIAQHLC
jgi:transcriptional regulator with XRE-family HTH domain